MIVSLLLTLLVDSIAAPPPPLRPALQAQPAQPSAPAPPGQPPAASSPSEDAATLPKDPAQVLVSTASAVLLVPVKASLAADYEAALTLLQGAFASSDDQQARQVAAGWKVMKAQEADSKGNVVYLHMLQPAMAGIDYRPSMWMDRLVQDLPSDVLDKYRDALAGPASLLSLTDVAIMSEAPAPAPKTDAVPDAPSGVQGTRPGPGTPPPTGAPVKRPGGR